MARMEAATKAMGLESVLAPPVFVLGMMFEVAVAESDVLVLEVEGEEVEDFVVVLSVVAVAVAVALLLRLVTTPDEAAAVAVKEAPED
jgi:hypothetical protein